MPVFEYMFIFLKEDKTFNPILDRKNKWHNTLVHKTKRLNDGTMKQGKVMSREYGQRFNMGHFPQKTERGKCPPPPFPEVLAHDHIISWSNSDTILDPFMGSGTTGVACYDLRRVYRIELDEGYFKIAKDRYEYQSRKIILIRSNIEAKEH